MIPEIEVQIRYRRSDTNELVRHGIAGFNDILSFEITAEVNSPGSANLVFKDRNLLVTKQLRINSDFEVLFIMPTVFQSIYLNSEDHVSTFQYILNSWTLQGMDGNDGIVIFSLSGGRFANYINKAEVIKDNSVNAIKKALLSRGNVVESGLEWLNYRKQSESHFDIVTADMPNKYGAWYNFDGNIYDYVNYIADHSNLAKDYLFWVYDDVKSVHVISSLNQQFASQSMDVILWVGDTNDSFDTPFRNKTGDYNVWYANAYVPSSFTGYVKGSLMPNCSYLLDFDTAINNSTVSFDKFLQRIDGGLYNTFSGNIQNLDIPYTDLKPVYGRKKVRSMSNLNTHALHSFSEDYRNLKYSMFSKKIELTIPHTTGPSVGQFVIFSPIDPRYFRDGVPKLDDTYSDYYFIESKKLLYDASQSDNVTAIISLISDCQVLDDSRKKMLNNRLQGL